MMVLRQVRHTGMERRMDNSPCEAVRLTVVCGGVQTKCCLLMLDLDSEGLVSDTMKVLLDTIK